MMIMVLIMIFKSFLQDHLLCTLLFSLNQSSSTKYNFNLGYFLGFRRFFLNSTKGIGYYVEFKNNQAGEGLTDTNNQQ